MRARTNGSDCEARGADPELVLGLLGERAGEGLGVARAVDGSFIARHFAFLVHATADPVERRAPPQEGERNALAEGGEHVAAADVGVFVFEQAGHAGRRQRDGFRQHDARAQEAGGHRAGGFRADDHAHAFHAGLQRLRKVSRTGAGDQALDSEEITAGAEQKESGDAKPYGEDGQAKVGQFEFRQREQRERLSFGGDGDDRRNRHSGRDDGRDMESGGITREEHRRDAFDGRHRRGHRAGGVDFHPGHFDRLQRDGRIKLFQETRDDRLAGDEGGQRQCEARHEGGDAKPVAGGSTHALAEDKDQGQHGGERHALPQMADNQRLGHANFTHCRPPGRCCRVRPSAPPVHWR